MCVWKCWSNTLALGALIVPVACGATEESQDTGGGTAGANEPGSGGVAGAVSPMDPSSTNVYVASIGSTECSTRQLPVDASGQIACSVAEAAPGPCNACATDGRRPVTLLVADAVRNLLGADRACDAPGTPDCGDVCVCEIRQHAGAELEACQHSAVAPPLPGFCYVDPAAGIGNSELTAACPDGQRRRFRFTGDGVPAPDVSLFVVCQTD